MTESGFAYSGNELDSMAEARNYYRWILSYAGPYVGQRTAEIGAGLGTFAARLLEHTNVAELTLVEPAGNLFPLLSRRYAEEPRVKVRQGYLDANLGLSGLDTVISVNVIEHVPDDVEFIRLAYRSLAPGGCLIIFVPALPGIFGSLDREFEHFRRYVRSELRAKLAGAGFGIEVLRYFNFPGVFSWFLAGRVLRMKTITSAEVRLYDRLMVPWVSALERIVAPPIGQNLLAVARKPKV